ncbi:hypothetical protein FJR48_01680 [Sulfurimonas lithotrophica]|uniref:Lipoprotein n=1 Tax=Sulfurimonas lithotrophica TaxID=2590022 RepID=A0A5P8NYN1_9BACT|nr:hypothetical protein [Sulfurimonas lithotrophica]QFR48504.1 hypothetical protein FJR48_01680 [Sulfurimonas lithotrophica]
MKKGFMSVALILAVPFVFLTGCIGASPNTSAGISVEKEKHPEGTLYLDNSNKNSLEEIVESAAKNSGWSITKFKSDRVIAEKIDGDTTYSATLKFFERERCIEFEKGSETSDSDISDLRDAIEDEAEKNSSGH